MMTAWFRVPPGWLPPSSLSIYHYCINILLKTAHFRIKSYDFELAHKKAPDERIKRKSEIERKRREAVVVCGSAD